MVIGDRDKQLNTTPEQVEQETSFTPCKTVEMQEIEDCINAFLFTPRSAERADAFLADWIRRFSRA